LTREEAVRILGLPPSADRDTVKRAYRQLVRSHHPDAGGDPATFHDL
jgi:curved DNA-binding protein CbpA